MYPWRTSKTAGAPPSLSKNIGLFKSENVAFGGTKLPSCHLHLEVLDLSSTFQGSKTIRSEMSEGEVTWSNCKTRSTGICLLDLLGSDGSDIWNIAKVLPRSTWNHDRGGCVRHVEATTCRFPSDQRVLMRPQWVLTILKLCRNNGHDWTWWYLNVLMIVTCCDNFFFAGAMWMPLHTRSERLRRLRGDVDSWTVGPAVGVNRFGLTKVRPPTVYQTIGSCQPGILLEDVGSRISSLSH